eukprot:487411-Prymnesium_polylepis.1
MKQAKEQLQALNNQLDAAGNDAPFSLALMHSVAQGAKDLGAPLSREQLVWALQRSKGDERLAISLAVSQANARRTLKVLRDPTLLSDFDVSRVAGAMVRKAKETLKAESLRRVIDELDLLDEEAGQGGGKKAGERPREGDTVLILSARDEEASKYIGRTGILEEDDETDQPFNVRFDDDETWWFYEGETESSDLL